MKHVCMLIIYNSIQFNTSTICYDYIVFRSCIEVQSRYSSIV